jgi:hypothetical protein
MRNTMRLMVSEKIEWKIVKYAKYDRVLREGSQDREVGAIREKKKRANERPS